MDKATTPERSKIPRHLRWNTTHLYRTDDDWELDRKRLLADLPKLAAYAGTLKTAKNVARCLGDMFASEQRLARLANYATRKNDEDSRVPKYQALKEVIEKASSDLATATAFVEPELLALPTKRLLELIADKRLRDYDRYLAELLRQIKHVLSRKEETLLARLSLIRDAGNTIYETFSAADLTFPSIRDEQGKSVKLTQSLFSRFRASSVRRVRRQAFERLFSTYSGYRNTFASLLSAQVNANIAHARARRYDNPLVAALHPDGIPELVYGNMIAAARRHLPRLHRYLRLRQRCLRVRKQHYYDLYTPIVDEVTFDFPYSEAPKILVDAMAPLGKGYGKALAAGLASSSGWIDPLPSKGKRSGAYMEGSAYEVHPYVLCNYLGDLNSLSTLAHEMGHAIHSLMSNAHQPYPKADYAIFVAEVASTLNEALLYRHLQSNFDGERRAYLLAEELEGFRQTFFRQAMFAEFELEIYRIAARDEALTAERLSELYLSLVRQYYGHDEGVIEVEPLYGIEWAYVPHFYYNFYVFQYVTGITAATALAELIRTEDKPASQRYITGLLQAGCSRPPIEILQSAGVDLTSTAPYDVTMSVFDRTLDELDNALR